MEIKLWGKVEINLWASGKGKSLMSTMSLGKLEVLERPKSKWPYWLLYRFENTYWPYNHTEDLKHIYLKMDLLRDRIPHCVERQWAQNTGANGRKYKTQYGILYKFLKEEDRLIFLMSRETGNELH